MIESLGPWKQRPDAPHAREAIVTPLDSSRTCWPRPEFHRQRWPDPSNGYGTSEFAFRLLGIGIDEQTLPA